MGLDGSESINCMDAVEDTKLLVAGYDHGDVMMYNYPCVLSNEQVRDTNYSE